MNTAISGRGSIPLSSFASVRLLHLGLAFLSLIALIAVSPGKSLAQDPTQSEQLLNTFTTDAFQTDLFTGAATAQIGIQAASAAAGLSPKITIRYSSRIVDDTKAYQASGVGLGWNLDTGGFILRDMKGTTSPGDDSFKLIFGGASYDLRQIDSTLKIYHTKDETFLKLQYFSTGDYWILTTKDGLQHRFGFNADSKMTGLTPDLKLAITWRYFLDEVKTTSGVAIRYSYVKKTATAKGTAKIYDQAVYPDVITYAYRNGALIGPAREVRFIRGPRGDWNDTTSKTFISLFEKERVDAIEVRVGGSLVRKYAFGFDYSIDRNPNSKWQGGATGDLTLKSVTVLGSDGLSALPPQSFTYSDAVLATASNGIGGAVSYTYEKLGETLYSTCKLENSDTLDCFDWGVGTPTVGNGAQSTVLGVILPKTPAGPRALYSSCVFENSDTGDCFDWGAGTVPSGTGPGSSLLGHILTSNPIIGGTTLYSVCLDEDPDTSACRSWGASTTPTNLGRGSTLLGYIYKGKIDRDGRHRVLTRTVNDGLGWSATTTLAYEGISSATPPDLPEEFRGHARVRSIDPLGHYTDNFFLQDALKKGRPSRIETYSSTGALFSKVVNTWATSTPFSGVTLVTLSRVDKYKCDGQATCLQTAQTFTYDSNGNPTQTVNLGDVSITGDERTEATTWSVNTTNWIHRPTRLTLTNSAGAVVRERWLTYDTRGLLTKEENRLAGAQGNAGNPVVTHAYDVFGNRTSTTDPLGCQTSMVYETSQTYPSTVTSCLGHQTSFTYDARFGVITSQTDPNLQTSTSEYDVLGRPTKKTGPLDTGSAYGSVSKFYLNFGDTNLQRVVTYTTEEHGTANVLVSEQYFDGLARADQTRSDGPNGETIATDVTFDIRGKVEKKSAPYFLSTETPIWTQFSYDVLGRQIQVTAPDGTVGTTSYLKDKITQTDANGNVRRKFLDAYDRQKRVEEVNGTATYVTTYEYNAIDALTKVTNHLAHVTTMTYDLMGRKTAMSDPNMGNWSYVYDKAGNLTRQTDATGQILNFTYDLQSRMTKKTYPDLSEINWTYDVSDLPDENYPGGRLTKVVDLAAETRFVYDMLGRVKKTERMIDGTPHVMAQQYNALGKMTSETFPDGDSVNYSYDTGFLNRIFDSTSDYVSGITYNARGQKRTIQYGNGVTSNFTYNDTGAAPDFRPINRATSGAGGSFQNLTYDYDNVGNITTITDSLFTASRTFTYDALNRLGTASGTFGALVGGVPDQASCTYTYDAIGNILNKCGITYPYNDPLHPSFVTATSDGKTYTADANGNTLTGAGRSFVWTPDNRVDSVTMGGTTTMDYDYTGIRVKKSGPLGLTVYPFAGYEIGPDGTKTKYFKVGNEMLAAKQTPTADPEKKLFYHNDHLGGVNVITDISGNRVQLTEYDPWGKVSRTEGNADPSHRFTGQELDPESGLYYYGGRYYDAELARFISPDPFIQAPDLSQNLNRYSYVLNNPVLLVDPTGHFFLIDDIILGAVIGAVLGSVTAAIIDQTPANVGFGALTGAISGGFFGAAGGIIENAAGLSGLSKVLIHTAAGMMSGAINAAITGSNVGMGAVTGGISAGIGNVFGQFLPDKFIYQLLGRTLAGGLSGGITAEISGRDFGDGFIFGAQMAAIAYLANDILHWIRKELKGAFKTNMDRLSFCAETCEWVLGLPLTVSGVFFTIMAPVEGNSGEEYQIWSRDAERQWNQQREVILKTKGIDIGPWGAAAKPPPLPIGPVIQQGGPVIRPR
jgi:RHS repeat-associated protein